MRALHPIACRATPLLQALLLALILTACGVDADSAPTLTPDPALPVTAAALFPSPIPTIAPTPTPPAAGDSAGAIARLVDALQSAVLRRDPAAYLALIDPADPVFALEQRHWVEDWDAPGVVLRFALAIRNLTLAADHQTASADLTMTWGTLTDIQTSRVADFPVRFTRGADGQWRYAGEDWVVTVEAGPFLVRAMPGLEATADTVAALLPEVYAHVTQALDHTPAGPLEVRLYDNPWTLIATTRLSLASAPDGWSAPGEALKIMAGGAGQAADAGEPGDADEATFAYHFARYTLYDLAGGTTGNLPLWALEGTAEVVAARYWTQADRNAWLLQLQERRRAEGLVNWDTLAAPGRLAGRLNDDARLQGYGLLHYVGETYGDTARNTWLRALASGTPEEATLSALGVTFAALNEGFLAWLDGQF